MESPRETKFGFKNRVGHEIRGKITGFKLAEGDEFWFMLLGASKNQGFKKSQESRFRSSGGTIKFL